MRKVVPVVALLSVALFISPLRAQSPAAADPAQAQIGAGDKISFDVASVKQNISGQGWNLNLPPGPDTDPGHGLYSATNFPLSFYISFAYKLGIMQTRGLASQLPKWANEENFDIQARAPESATVGQMRLMMQSLLAERFHLSAHFETRQERVYALELVKAGIPGPKLQPHSADPPCPDQSAPAPVAQLMFSRTPAGLPVICGAPVGAAGKDGISYSGRDVPMRLFAENLASTPNTAFDRPIVDRTGLAGNFDFLLKYSVDSPGGVKQAPEDMQAYFLEAMKEQLGLKLESATGSVDVFVVDHIEEPTPN